jgi:hypothetical protein
MVDKICGSCRHFTQDDCDKNIGNCDLTLDYNDYFTTSDLSHTPDDRIFGWDYEGYSAGAYVGVKFGCIHWETVNAA